jgi:hypothetical protein
MIAVLVAIIVVRAVFAYMGLGWEFAAAMSFGLMLIYVAYAFLMKEELLKRVILFALVAGFTELIADKWLVDVTKTLVYYPDEPFIVRSPVYMPFSWAAILTSIGYTSHLISKHEDKWKTIALTVLMGGIIIPIFECWAYFAQWWWYQNCDMVYHVPYYIILGEAIICVTLAGVIHAIENKSFLWAMALGIFQGLWIWLSYYVGLLVFPHS